MQYNEYISLKILLATLYNTAFNLLFSAEHAHYMPLQILWHTLRRWRRGLIRIHQRLIVIEVARRGGRRGARIFEHDE